MKVLLVTLVGLLATGLFHREAIFSGFTLIESDTVDSLLNIFLLEHSFQSTKGVFSWWQPPYFHPSPDSRAYTDLLLGISALYIPIRYLGFEMFNATSIIFLSMTFLSYLTCYFSARMFFRLSLFPAIVSSVIFAVSYPRFTQLSHLQLQFTMLNPIILGCAYCLICRAATLNAKQYLRYSLAIAVLLPVLLATNVYQAFFSAVFILALLIGTLTSPTSLVELLKSLKTRWMTICATALLFSLLIFPIYQIFSTLILSGAGREWGEVDRYLVDPYYFWWLGSENLTWGWLAESFPLSKSAELFAEARIGLGLVVTLSLLLFCSIRFVNSFRKGNLHDERIFIAAFLVCLLLPLKFGADLSLWQILYDYAPAADGIRAVSRFYLFLTFPAAILFGRLIDWVLSKQASSISPNLIVTGFVCLALFEQLGRPATFKPETIEKQIEIAASKLDRSCDAFLLTPSSSHQFFNNRRAMSSGEIEAVSQENFDAAGYLELHKDVADKWEGTAFEHYQQYGRNEGRMLNHYHQSLNQKYQTHSALVAVKSGIPTVAGYSGHKPPEWNLDDVFSTDLDERVETWRRKKGIVGKVCLVPIDLH